MTRARCATAAAVQGWLKLSRARSLLAGLACLELAGESVDFVQLLLLLFPLTIEVEWPGPPSPRPYGPYRALICIS